MNRLTKIILLTLPLSLTDTHAVEKRVQDFVLDDHTVYEVPVSATRVTTISFPPAIAAIDAALTTLDGKTPGVFQIAHTKGTAYLSVRALAEDAATNLNVRWNNRTYVFELRQSTEPWYSVVLQRPPGKSNHTPRPLTPPRLIGLLDKAKAFSLLKTQQSDAVAGVEHRDLRDKPQISDCGDYEVRLMEAFRFPDDDTIVFQLTITNRTDKPIEHTPEKLEVHIGDRIVNPSVSDLTSSIAAHETTSGYIAISGGLEGPNNVSLKTSSRLRSRGTTQLSKRLLRRRPHQVLPRQLRMNQPRLNWHQLNRLLYRNEPASFYQFLSFAYRRANTLSARPRFYFADGEQPTAI